MSETILRTLPVADLGTENQLFSDYIADPMEGIGGTLQGFSGEVSFWRDLLERLGCEERRKRESDWKRVVDGTLQFSERAGTIPQLLEKLDRAKTEEVVFVVTGQQPGLLGGSLLSLYKALTAVSLSARLEDMLSRPCVPLFWVAGDDTDFQEIRSFSILDRDFSLLSVSLPEETHETGVPVGSIPIDPVIESWEQVARFSETIPGRAFVRDWVLAGLQSAVDNGEAFAGILGALTEGKLAFIDGQSRPIREKAQPLFIEYLDKEDEIKKAVLEQGRWFEENGYHAQLSVGKDSGIFLMEGGKRRTVAGDRIPLLEEAVRKSVDLCSAGVILRNLIQDDVFRPAAVVLGPAEVAYRAQMADLYQEFAIPRPAAVPRLTATYIPPPFGELLEKKTATEIDALLLEPSRFIGTLYDEFIPETMREALVEFKKQVGASIEVFSRAADGVVQKKVQGRLSGRIKDLKRRLDQIDEVAREAGKAAALERFPYLANIVDMVKPRGKSQERVLSCLTPFLFSGSAAFGVMREVAEYHVNELMDENTCHIVYST